VGSAIVNHLGKPIAALSIAGPSVRITKKDANKFGPIVKETTKIISKTLGA
jgi:DNA-binding IclR family transcriptional regulator